MHCGAEVVTGQGVHEHGIDALSLAGLLVFVTRVFAL
jgi:hypothetical protein